MHLNFPIIFLSKSFCHFARYLPADLPDDIFELYFKYGTIIFSETWYVTISDSTASPLQVSANSMEWFFHYGLKRNEIIGKKCNYNVILPDAVFGLFFKNGTIIFSETWYVKYLILFKDTFFCWYIKCVLNVFRKP